MASLLCDAGADPGTSNRVGVTPLHSAAEKNAADVALLLLQHGADVSAANSVGDTPLHWAAEKGHLGVARALLGAGADACRSNKYGSTPLHAAAAGGAADAAPMVALLVRNGAVLGAVDSHGKSAADVAVTDDVRDALLSGRVDAHTPGRGQHVSTSGAPFSPPPRIAGLPSPRQLQVAQHSPAWSEQRMAHRADESLLESVGTPVLRSRHQDEGDDVTDSVQQPWSPPAGGGRVSVAASESSRAPHEWLPDGTTGPGVVHPLVAPTASAPSPLMGEDFMLDRVAALQAGSQSRSGCLAEIPAALEQARTAMPVYAAACEVAEQLRLLRMASSLRAEADAAAHLAASLAHAQQLADGSRTALAQRRSGVRAVVGSSSPDLERALAKAASERDRAQATHKATVARAASLAQQLADMQQQRAAIVASLSHSIGDDVKPQEPEDDGMADLDAASASARAMVTKAARSLVPACERTSTAAQALLDALRDEVAVCAQVHDAMTQALIHARRASAAAAGRARLETPALDAQSALALARVAQVELLCLAALEEQRTAASAAAMQLRGIEEARLEAQLAAEELQSEARKARLRGSWPPGRQAAHAAAEQQCVAMLAAYDDDAARLRASLSGGPLDLAYPELTGWHAVAMARGGSSSREHATLTRSAVEVRETLRRTERGSLLRVSWPGSPQPGGDFALKELPGRGGAAWEAQCRRLTAIKHPLVLPLLGAFTDDSGAACLLMPLQRRGSLRAAAELHFACPPGEELPGDAPPWPAWRRVLRQVMQGLAALHAAGVLHGAVHWDNIMWADPPTSESDIQAQAHGDSISPHIQLEGDVLLADARAAAPLSGREDPWAGDVAAVGTLAKTLCAHLKNTSVIVVSGGSTLHHMAQVCHAPGASASASLLHPGCGALDQVPTTHSECALAHALRAVVDAAASVVASTGAAEGRMRVEVSGDATILRDLLLAHDTADVSVLGRPWHMIRAGSSVPASAVITAVLTAMLLPDSGLFEAPPAADGGHDGMGTALRRMLPCRDDAPPCQQACGLPRAVALRACGRLLAKAMFSGIGTLPLELLPVGYAALLDPETVHTQLLADAQAAVFALAQWDKAAAAPVAHRLACRVAPSQASATADATGRAVTEATKSSVVAADAVAQLLGCRYEGMRALSQGFMEAVGAHPRGEAVAAALRAFPLPMWPSLAAVMNSTCYVAPAPMVTALLWADSWPPEAQPMREHLVAWLHSTTDVMRALFSLHAWGSLQPPCSLLLVLPAQQGAPMAATFGGDRTLTLPLRVCEQEFGHLLHTALLP